VVAVHVLEGAELRGGGGSLLPRPDPHQGRQVGDMVAPAYAVFRLSRKNPVMLILCSNSETYKFSS